MTSTLTFCGRDSEFERLLERWHMACDVQVPSPQVVVIKAERGLGKTRRISSKPTGVSGPERLKSSK
jgi:hypothetical protein